MKALLIFIGLLGCLCKSDAQTIFGIAYYNVPEGWQVVQQSPNVILEAQRKDGKKCRIILSATEKVVIDNESAYRAWRIQKSSDGFSFKAKDSVVRKENEYCIAFISQATGVVNNLKMTTSFYSFTNKRESFSVQFIAEPGLCDDVLRAFIKTLEVEDGTAVIAENTFNKSGTKRTSKPRGRPRKNPA
jgi:hypothetical protein